ncbi:MAG TPA: hypothetical protein VKB88_30590 [Bryobacteraceae bacterium]|nr:hypothetical protein [Bryobacteraceae bacterium]
MCGAARGFTQSPPWSGLAAGTLMVKDISLEESVMANNDWDWGSQSTKIWVGIAIGAAVGLGIALSRRRPATRWDSAREFGKRISDRSEDLADATRDIMTRVRTIYDEGRKVLEDAGELWSHGRKLVGAR